MLYKNSSKRISLEEIENHPWLTIDEKGFPYRIKDSVYESSSTGINYETIDVIDKEMLNRAPYFSLSDLSNIKKSLKLKEKTKQTLLYQILRKQVLISELAPKISLILEPLSYQNRLSCIKCASADIGKQICQNELKTTFASILPPLNASETEKLSSPKILKPLNINITTHATDAIVKKRRQTAGMISTANFANVVKTRQIQFRRLSIIPASTS